MPYYAGLKVGVPSLPAVVDALAGGPLRPAAPVHARPGRDRRGADRPAARAADRRLATTRSWPPTRGAALGRRAAEAAHRPRAGRLLRRSATSCSRRSTSTDDRLGALGIPAERIARWDRGVDLARFSPERRVPGLLDPSRINVLYAGRLTREKGVDLLADAFLEAHRLRPALQLVLAGGGPEEAALRERLGDAGDVPRLARGRRARRRLRVGRPVPVLLADRHLRAGAARGAGLGAAGRRGRRGRPGRARRARPQRPAVLARPRACSASRSPGSRAPRRRAGGSPAAACGRSRSAPGRPRSAGSRRAGSSRSPASAPLPPGPRRREVARAAPGGEAGTAARRVRGGGLARAGSPAARRPCEEAATGALEGDALEHVGRRLARVDGGLERLEDVLPADHDHRVDAVRRTATRPPRGRSGRPRSRAGGSRRGAGRRRCRRAARRARSASSSDARTSTSAISCAGSIEASTP